jgi:Dockerin type I domain
VNNAQVIDVTLTNVNDVAGNSSNSVSISMGVLFGDTSGNGSVNSSDVSQTKENADQAVNASNFRTDVNASGNITDADIGLVKSMSGTSLSPAAKP